MLRNVLLVASSLIFLWVFVTGLRALRTTPDQIDILERKDPDFVRDFKHVELAEKIARDDVGRFFQISILLIAGLWSIAVINKEIRLQRGDYPEIVMFVCANGLLLASQYFTNAYSEVLSETLMQKYKPFEFFDPIGSPYLYLHRSIIYQSFYGGVVIASMCTISLCFLRERGPFQRSVNKEGLT